MTKGDVLYGKQGNSYILKYVGDIRYTLSCKLDNFLDDLFAQDDFDQILIDLTETTNIDSTNLGLLAKIANFIKSHFDHKPLMVSTNPEINQVLQSMGFDDVFERCGDCRGCLEPANKMEDCHTTKAQMAKIMLDAHTRLININEPNRKKFQDVVNVLQNSVATSG